MAIQKRFFDGLQAAIAQTPDRQTERIESEVWAGGAHQDRTSFSVHLFVPWVIRCHRHRHCGLGQPTLDIYLVHVLVMESLPTVVKEAFFLKIPIVATNVGGIPELIENDVSGILVEPNNPTELSNAILDLIENGTTEKTIECVGPEELTFKEIIEKLLILMEKKRLIKKYQKN